MPACPCSSQSGREADTPTYYRQICLKISGSSMARGLPTPVSIGDSRGMFSIAPCMCHWRALWSPRGRANSVSLLCPTQGNICHFMQTKWILGKFYHTKISLEMQFSDSLVLLIKSGELTSISLVYLHSLTDHMGFFMPIMGNINYLHALGRIMLSPGII